MIIKHTAKTLRNTAIALAAAVGLLSTPACHTIYDDTDCYQSYNRVLFYFDHNMKFADAFDNEVDHVTLLVFDHATGTLVSRIDAPHQSLSEDNGVIVDIEPGTYDFLTWAGSHTESFDIASGSVGHSKIEDFHCRMRRLDDTDGHHVRDDLAPLWHNLSTVELQYASPSHPNTVKVSLKKNTNTFRIVLQQISENPQHTLLNADDFDIVISDDNGWMNHDNTLRDDNMISYHPWLKYSGSIDINTNPTPAPDGQPAPDYDTQSDIISRSQLGGMLAELTTGRLIDGKNPTLSVIYTDPATQESRNIMQIKLLDYVRLVKGYYNRDMSDQEYFDRQDEHNMTFFLDEGYRWHSAMIIINDWVLIRKPIIVE